MTWPFTRAKPGGYVSNDVPTAAELNKIDLDQSLAADGSLWTDVAVFRNINAGVTVTNRGSSLLYDPTTDFYYSFGVSGGNPVGSRSRMGQHWEAITIPAGAGLTPGLVAASTEASGILLIGGSPGSSSNQKFRRSVDGVNWATQNSSQTSTAGIACIAYSAALALFIAGHTDGKVETSPDGVTWTNRTVPNADARTDIAINSGIVVIGTSAGNRVITSPDGINWTARTITGLSSSSTVCWSGTSGKFYAVHNVGTAGIASSADGITWSISGVTLPATIQSPIQIRSYGRVLAVLAAGTTEMTNGGIPAFSVDGAASWTYGGFMQGTGADSFCFGKAQLVASDNGGVHYASLSGYY